MPTSHVFTTKIVDDEGNTALPAKEREIIIEEKNTHGAMIAPPLEWLDANGIILVRLHLSQTRREAEHRCIIKWSIRMSKLHWNTLFSE